MGAPKERKETKKLRVGKGEVSGSLPKKNAQKVHARKAADEKPKLSKLKSGKNTPQNSIFSPLEGFEFSAGLTEGQKNFVHHFCCPGGRGYRNPARAARLAGYSEKSAVSIGYQLRHNAAIAAEIRRYDAALGEGAGIFDAAQRFLAEKVVRADYDVSDFFRIEERASEKTGDRYSVLVPKPLEEIAEEKRVCIDGIELQGKYGSPVYILADRRRERDSLIEYWQRMREGAGADEGYDVETLSEIVKGELKVKTRVMKRRRLAAESAEGFYQGGG